MPSLRGCAWRSTRHGRDAVAVRPARSICLLFSGYFERLSSERGTPWWVADSLNLQAFPTRMLRARRRAARCCRVRGCWSSWTRIWRGSRGCWSGCPTRFRCVGRWSASIRRRWNRMPRCGASSGGIPATRTRLSCGVWRRGRGGDTGCGWMWLGFNGRGQGKFANNERPWPRGRAKGRRSGGRHRMRVDVARFDRSRQGKIREQRVPVSSGREDREDDGRPDAPGPTWPSTTVALDTRAIVSVTVHDVSDGDTVTLPDTLIDATMLRHVFWFFTPLR